MARRELPAGHGLTGPMNRRGNPYDNAKTERSMNKLMVEAVHLAAYESFANVIAELPRFIDGIHILRGVYSVTGYLSPVQSKDQHVRQMVRTAA